MHDSQPRAYQHFRSDQEETINTPLMQNAMTNHDPWERSEPTKFLFQQHLLDLVSGEGELPMSNFVPCAIGFCADSPFSNVLLDTIL